VHHPPRNWISKRYPLAALLGTRGCPEEGSQRISFGLTNVQPRGNPKRSHDHFGAPFGHRPRARPGCRRALAAAVAAWSGRRCGRLVWPPLWPLGLAAVLATLDMATALAAGFGRRRMIWPPPIAA